MQCTSVYAIIPWLPCPLCPLATTTTTRIFRLWLGQPGKIWKLCSFQSFFNSWGCADFKQLCLVSLYCTRRSVVCRAEYKHYRAWQVMAESAARLATLEPGAMKIYKSCTTGSQQNPLSLYWSIWCTPQRVANKGLQNFLWIMLYGYYLRLLRLIDNWEFTNTMKIIWPVKSVSRTRCPTPRWQAEPW